MLESGEVMPPVWLGWPVLTVKHLWYSFGAPALHYATINGREEVVRELLARQYNARAVDEQGWTPLHYAALFDQRNIAALLLENGADVRAWSKDNQLAVDVAETSQMRSLLIEWADRTSEESTSNTPTGPDTPTRSKNARGRAAASSAASMTQKLQQAAIPSGRAGGGRETPTG